MKTQPKISIITPSFNQGQYIEQTIVSIIDQSYNNVELIIIDGGSTDNTVSVIKKYEDRIAYWVSEKDEGQAHAINKGLAQATGDIFNWLNSDDYLQPSALQYIADGFAANPDAKIICGFTKCFYHDDGTESHTYQMGIRKTVAETLLNVEMNQPGSFYNIQTIRDLGGINESLRYVFDGELWFRFLCRYGLQAVSFTTALLANFRLHKASKSVGEGFFEFYKEFLNIHLFLAEQLNFSPALISYLKDEQYVDVYKPDQWCFDKLEKETLEKYFLNKYKYLLYKDRNYDLARKGLIEAFKTKDLKELKLLGTLALKLALPNSLIEILRPVKSDNNG